MFTLNPIEKEFFEELFGMETGYILENVEAKITNARNLLRDLIDAGTITMFSN